LNFTVPVELRGENPPLRLAAKRYQKPYDDSANIKMTDMKRTNLDYIINRLTSKRNEVLFFAPARFLFFNFFASAHLVLPDTQANPSQNQKSQIFPRLYPDNYNLS